MLKAIVNLVSKEVFCPTCYKSNYTIFRRDELEKDVYLNHCRCECGQIFVYKVNHADELIGE